MKQITEPIDIFTSTIEEHGNVYDRLISMGFTHSCDEYQTREAVMRDGDCYHTFTVLERHLAGREFSRTVSKTNDTITAAQFLAEYGPAEVAAPETPLNPPNFTVDTGNDKTLSRIVQSLAFSAELTWSDSKTFQNRDFRYIHITRSPHGSIFDKAGLMLDTTSIANCAKDRPVYSAATQMGEIVRLLSTPVVPPMPPPPTPPEIHGYKAVYTAGAPTVDFGCAKLGKNLLRDAAKLMGCVINSDGSVMRDAGIVPEQGCNRAVDSIVLSSGKTLSRENVRTILDYIAAVEEYAKKYCQKS